MSAPQPVQKRNVIVLGKTGTGKSTVANKIAGDNNFDIAKTLKSATSKVSHCEATTQDPKSNIRYDFKIIDTIGLFDTSIDDKKNNDQIMKEIKEYLNDVIPEGITLVLFIFRQGRYTQEEQETFKFITENFRGDISEISALVITNCENEDDDARQDIIDDFKKTAKQTATFMEKGIYAVGFPDITTMKPKLRAVFEDDIERDTEKLRELVKRAGEMRLGKKLFEQTFWERVKNGCTIL